MLYKKTLCAQSVLLKQLESFELESNQHIEFSDKKHTKSYFENYGNSNKKNWSESTSRNSRYQIRNTIQKIMSECSGNWRVGNCGKKRISVNSPVGISYTPCTCKAHYTNLQKCGSIWICPVCAHKKNLQRQQDLRQLKPILTELGINVYMLTLTIPHHKKDRLYELTEAMSLAKKRFWSDTNSTKLWTELFPNLGHITSIEITYSERAGWHPHYHILFFTLTSYSDTELESIQKSIYQLWAEKCVKVGLKKPNKKYGVHLIKGGNHELFDGKNIMEYIVKNGFYSSFGEMTGGENSTENSQLTIWQIAQLAEDVSVKTSRKYKSLVQEYAIATKGKRQCVWSKKIIKFLKQNLEKINKSIPKLKGKLNKKYKKPMVVNVIQIPATLWDSIRRSPFNLACQLLFCVEQDFIDSNNTTQNFARTKRFFRIFFDQKIECNR